MAHRKSFTLFVISLLLVIPLFSEGTEIHDTEMEDPGSGEIHPPRRHLGYGSSSEEGGEENQPSVSQGQDPEPSEEEETVQQSTPSSVAAVGKENGHLPREPDVEEHEPTTAAPSAEVPLAPIPPEEQDVAGQESNSQQPPHNEILVPEPSQTVIIWDGTSEPDRELPISQPEEPASQPEQPVNQPEQPVNKPELPVNQPEKPANQSNEPLSQELHGGANGNGQTGENGSDQKDKSSSDEARQADRPHGGKPVPVTASGSTSSSMAWVVVFAVVSSALLISGLSDSEADIGSSCHLGCRHNFDDFNPYAWPPTPVNRKEITLRPIT